MRPRRGYRRSYTGVWRTDQSASSRCVFFGSFARTSS
jgi:hypothetical protein